MMISGIIQEYLVHNATQKYIPHGVREQMLYLLHTLWKSSSRKKNGHQLWIITPTYKPKKILFQIKNDKERFVW